MPYDFRQYEGSKRRAYQETGATEPDSEEVSRSREEREGKTETDQGQTEERGVR